MVGQEFWHRLTGDEHFYHELISAIGQVAVEADFSKDFERVIETLAASEVVQKLSNHE